MASYAIYVRVSERGDREGESYMTKEEQEAAGRDWCERNGFEAYFVEDECVDEDVSGAAAAEDRRLGRLIERCESREFAGIVVRAEDRFARDPIAGGVALDRLVECGARLVATYSGFDSENLTPEKQMVFDIMMAIGRAQRKRNRLARMNGSRRAADQGYYLASKAPLGYRFVNRRERRDGTPGVGKLEIDPETAPLVVEAFRMRGRGASTSKIRSYLAENGVEISKGGIGFMLKRRAYLGIATKPTERKGEVEEVPNAHDALITPDEWQAAQASCYEYAPRTGVARASVHLAGLVYCASCGKRMQVQIAKGGSTYCCRGADCPAGVGITARILDAWVAEHIRTQAEDGNPHILSVLTGEGRWARAMSEVQSAQEELDFYRRSIRVSDVGLEAWKDDVAHRQSELDAARRQLAATPRPRGGSLRSRTTALDDLREVAPSLIERIDVSPVGRGRRVAPDERCVVWWVGEREVVDGG